MKTKKNNPLPQDDFTRLNRGAAEARLLLCEQDAVGTVLRQNRRCRDFCGKRIGQRCSDGCKAVLDSFTRSLQLRENAVVHGKCVDLAEIRVGRKTFVVMETHAHRYRKFFAALAGCGLTPAEERVVRMKVAGFSLAAIGRALFVARTTVKTHLLHAYQKLPPRLAERCRNGR